MLSRMPDILTGSRLVLAVVLFVTVGAETPSAYMACFWMLVLASITDMLDGHIARMIGLSTSFGRVVDPLVDKVLTCGCFVLLASVPGPFRLSPYVAVVVLTRELMVTTFRSAAEAGGRAFGATIWGKAKMATQMVTICGTFIALASKASPADPVLLEIPSISWGLMMTILVWAAIVSTVGSGLVYAVALARPAPE